MCLVLISDVGFLQSKDIDVSIAFEISEDYMAIDKHISTKFVGKITNTGENFSLIGVLSASLKFACGRCLCETLFDLDVPVCETFVENLTRQNDFETVEDGDYFCYLGDYVDITCAIETNLLLNIPSKILCDENCLGLCQTCGCNLNVDNCDCANNKIDPRFEPLRDFFKDKEV